MCNDSLGINIYNFRRCYIRLANVSTEEADENTDLTGSRGAGCGLLLAEDAQDGTSQRKPVMRRLNSLYSMMFSDEKSSLSFFRLLCAGGRPCVLTLQIVGLQFEHSFCVQTDGELRMKCAVDNILLTFLLAGVYLLPLTIPREEAISLTTKKKVKAIAFCCLSASYKTSLTHARWNKCLHFDHWEEKSMYMLVEVQNLNSLCGWFLFKN